MSEPPEPARRARRAGLARASDCRAKGDRRRGERCLLLALVLDAFEEGPYRAKRWLLSYRRPTMGPTPPSGFDKIADYPQLDTFPGAAAVARDAQGGDDNDDQRASRHRTKRRMRPRALVSAAPRRWRDGARRDRDDDGEAHRLRRTIGDQHAMMLPGRCSPTKLGSMSAPSVAPRHAGRGRARRPAGGFG